MGIIENMSGYVCPSCGECADLLRMGAGEILADELGVPFLGRIPLNKAVSDGSDQGVPFVVGAPDCDAAKVFDTVVDNVETSVAKLVSERAQAMAASKFFENAVAKKK